MSTTPVVFRRRRILRIAAILVGISAAAAVIALLLRRDERGDQGRARERRVPVVTTPARRMPFERTVRVSGTIQAVTYALVSARLPGTLDAVFVDEADTVEGGVTKLFQTDALKVTKALEAARQERAIADSYLRERTAYLAEVQAEYDQAALDLERYRRLSAKNAATAHELELKVTEHGKWAAKLEHAKAFVALAEAQQKRMVSTVAMAEKDARDSLVLAPVSGRVSRRLKEPGEMAAAGTPVVRIDDLSHLEVSAFLPEEFYADIAPGTTRMRVRTSGTDLGELVITFKSATVDEQLRTFEITGSFEDPPAGVVPGRLVEIHVILDRREGIGVPAAAVITRGGRDVLFRLDGDTVRLVPVTAGLYNDGWIEVTGSGLAAGTPVVSMGQDFVTDRATVRVVEEKH